LGALGYFKVIVGPPKMSGEIGYVCPEDAGSERVVVVLGAVDRLDRDDEVVVLLSTASPDDLGVRR
jgi:hypothetical protein